MGKGQIISGGANGQYQVKILYSRVEYDAQMLIIDSRLIALQTAHINAPTTTPKERAAKDIIGLQIAALEKRQANLEANVLLEETISAWCSDLTEDLSGDIGTVEIPGESTNIQIQPGYENNAAYNLERDGQLVPTYNASPAGVYYNLAMLPGWQKWKPLFRYATIDSINSGNDTANITLENIKSSQQDIEINQTDTLSDVAIEYMTCDSVAFEEGDSVLVKFDDQDWTKPKIVGFKDNPQPCGVLLLVALSDEVCFVWDLELNAYGSILDNNDDPAIFPIEKANISNWLSEKDLSGDAAFTSTVFGQITFVADCDYVNHDTVDCWIKIKDCSENQNINGRDSLGNTGFSATSLRTTEQWQGRDLLYQHVNGISIDIDFEIPIRGGTIQHFEMTSTTNVGGIKARTSSDEYSLSVEYEQGTGGVCNRILSPALGDGRIQNNDITETMVVESPFADGESTHTLILSNNWQALYGGSWSYQQHYNYNDLTDSYNADGIKGSESIPHMVVFFVEQTVKSTVSYTECGNVNYSFPLGLPVGLLNQDSDPCTQDPETTYAESTEYRVKAFSQKTEGDIDDLDPFDLTANSDLSDAMESLKDKYEIIHGVPTLPDMSNNDFSLDFVS